MSVPHSYRAEIPEIEDLVDWLLDQQDSGGCNSVREMREALHKAYVKGQQCGPDDDAYVYWSARDDKGEWQHHRCGVKEAGALLTEVHKRLAWRSMEEAPKDNTEILAYNDDGIRCVIRWSKHNHVPMWGWIRQIELYGEEVDGFDPLGWMPLPDVTPATSSGVAAHKSEGKHG